MNPRWLETQVKILVAGLARVDAQLAVLAQKIEDQQPKRRVKRPESKDEAA
jgi:hypothetical protein